MARRYKNSDEAYGLVAGVFHWLIAVLVIGVLGLGLYMVEQEPSPAMFKLYFFHKSFGVTILALALLRLCWRFLNIVPLPLSSHKKWERVLARATHLALYFCLLAMPLSGWIMSSAKGFSVSVFGWFTLPDFVAEDKALADVAEEFHGVVAYVLIGLIVLHAAGALKHHFIDKDQTLRRMLSFGRNVVVVFVLAALIQSVNAAPHGEAPLPRWEIIKEQSAITFKGVQMGAAFEGVFSSFDGEIVFDPEALDQARVEMVVDVAAVTTKSAERDEYILAAAWFDTAAFPTARFVSDQIVKTGPDQYEATGEMSIKGVSKAVTIPFSLVFKPDDAGRVFAEMESTFSLARLDYGVGSGEWTDTEMVGNDVEVLVTLVAAKAEPAL